LGAYFKVAEKIAGSLSDDDRIEIHAASVRLAGGHLRSQIRYYSINKSVPFDDTSLILLTRNSNALDFALLIQDLVPLLEAYEKACRADDRPKRLALADVICQGVSPDPDLFLRRVTLLRAYSMIEHLFVTTDADAPVVYTAIGQRHVDLVRKYEALIERASKALHDDCSHFRPVGGTYSPFGVLYGFASDLLEHMALKTLQPDAITRFSVEDVFTSAEGDADRLAWVRGWRNLPHLTREMTKLFDYPQPFAEEIFGRLERALGASVTAAAASSDATMGRLFVLPAETSQADAPTPTIPDLPLRFIRSSDRQIVADRKAEPYNETHLLAERREGKSVVSYRTTGGWVAISKDILTEVLGAGRDAKIDVPADAAAALTLTCPDLIVLPESAART
jgi:hypothetical protein